MPEVSGEDVPAPAFAAPTLEDVPPTPEAPALPALDVPVSDVPIPVDPGPGVPDAGTEVPTEEVLLNGVIETYVDERGTVGEKGPAIEIAIPE